MLKKTLDGVSLSRCCCNTESLVAYNDPISCLTVLEVKSQKGAKVKVSAFLLEALAKNLFSYLFQIQEPTHMPCPVAPSSIFQASSIASSKLSPLTLLLPPVTYKDTCDYTE